MSKSYFVTGIDTDIGKTVVSAILVKALNASYWKPVQSGSLDNSDSMTVKRLVPEARAFQETYRLTQPLSPHASARIDGVKIELAEIVVPEHDGNLIIEGAGGLCVPLDDDLMIVDLIERLSVPVILVSKNYLGSINHTVMTIELLKARDIEIAAIIFVGEKNLESERFIENKARKARFFHIPWSDQVDEQFVSKQAALIRNELL